MSSPATMMLGCCLCTSLVDLELLPVPSHCLLGHGAATVPVLSFLQCSRKHCHHQSRGCSLSQGLQAPVLTLWPAGSLHYGSESPRGPLSLRNTFMASTGEQPQAGPTPSSSPVR